MMDFIGIIIYILQELGIAIGVGAATVGMVLAIRNHHIENNGIAGGVERLGIWMVVATAAAITFAHLVAREGALIMQAPYAFQWVIIASSFAFNMLAASARSRNDSHAPMAVLAAASWYALFLFHLLAPQGSWGEFIAVYAAWLVAFFGIFSFMTKEKAGSTAQNVPPTQTLNAPQP